MAVLLKGQCRYCTLAILAPEAVVAVDRWGEGPERSGALPCAGGRQQAESGTAQPAPGHSSGCQPVSLMDSCPSLRV